MAVRTVLENLGIVYSGIELGRVELPVALTAEQRQAFNTGLLYYELEILDNKKTILVERIRNIIREMVLSDSPEPTLKFTVYLAEALGYDYTHLSNVFTDEAGSTIERFYITTRVERVKELMVYEERALKEIAFKLNYSSVSHLCLQFKKVTGHTPSEFKKLCMSPHYVWKK